MANHPLVSVVIPAFKARNFLKQALISVAQQDYPNLEVWVIDDKSPEPIDDIITDYRENSISPPLEVLRHQTNQGLGAARNTGIQVANGEFIALLDHDDVWAPCHVSDVINQILLNQADLGFCTALMFTDNPAEWHGTWGPSTSANTTHPGFDLLQSSYITPSSAIIRRSSLLEIGGFNTDPKAHMCEDHDLWLRLASHGARFIHSQKPTVYYRKHSEQATSKKGYMAFQSAYVRELHSKQVKAPWFKKRSLIANHWWAAWVTFLEVDGPRWGVFARAIWQGLPVPWEIARGLVHTARYLKRSKESSNNMLLQALKFIKK